MPPLCREMGDRAIDRYLVFHIPIDEDIEILRIVNGYRDLSALLPDAPTDE